MKFLLLLIVRINILISKKYSHSNDFPCNVLKLTKRKNANQRFSSVLIRIECLLNFCKEYLKSILVVINPIKSMFISY